MQLLSNAMESARQQGFGKLQLDVLSDNSCRELLPVHGVKPVGGISGTNSSAAWCTAGMADGYFLNLKLIQERVSGEQRRSRKCKAMTKL